MLIFSTCEIEGLQMSAANEDPSNQRTFNAHVRQFTRGERLTMRSRRGP